MKNYEAFGTPAMIITVAVLAAGMILVWQNRDHLDHALLLYLAGWSVWTCFVFLPKMHERYDYLALILLTAYTLAYRRRISWTMVVANLCTAMGYGYYLFEELEGWELFTFLELAIPYNIAYFALTADLVRQLCRGQQTDRVLRDETREGA